MDLHEVYQSKCIAADQAAKFVESGTNISMGMAMAEPPALLQALARRASAGKVRDLKIYYFEATPIAGETVLDYHLNQIIRPHCMFVTATDRKVMRQAEAEKQCGAINYVPSNFHEAPRLLAEEIGIDAFLCTVCPMDHHGYFSFGTGNDYSTRVARSARHLLVEVNRYMPRVYGSGAALHVSEVSAIVENHVPLLETSSRAANEDDVRIGRTIADLVPDGACLQMGVGTLPNLVCKELRDRNDLGIHTEALNSGLVDLMQSGVITNRNKVIDRGLTVFSFAMGNKEMYDFLHENPAISSRPIDYVNNPSVIAQNDLVVSINATLQVDLTGACNSEHLLGRQYSACGGQLDFVRGAFASKGGKSIIATRSTAAAGKVSRVVARLDGPVTTPRVDTHYVVTEFGAANLKGVGSAERARTLIGLSHPSFRDELSSDAQKLGLI